jgi:hypothetical protein
MEPSTSERSYVLPTTARDASGKLAISIAPATARSSSSQSNRLSWHPSHEANFQTANFGFDLYQNVMSNVGKLNEIFVNMSNSFLTMNEDLTKMKSLKQRNNAKPNVKHQTQQKLENRINT